MVFTASSVPDLTGTHAVVTGANGGLGLETAKALAAKNAHVFMAVRNRSKAEVAAAAIRAENPTAELTLIDLDLGSLASIAAAAESIRAASPVVDLLVNNAGVMATPEGRTTDGFETQLGTNHLGHWALTAHLMPALVAARSARVVSVTSTAHHIGKPIDPDNPHLEGAYTPWGAYGQSKLANYHFALGLERQFRAANVRPMSLMAHPGLSDTNLQSTTTALGGAGGSGPFFEKVAKFTGMKAAVGARPQLRAATDPKASGGQLYGPLFVNNGPAVRRPLFRPGADGAIAVLWSVSERETGMPMVIS